jgi:hypothetical protein
LPWAWLLATGLQLGWRPADVWASTLYEIETALWLAIRPAETPAMSEAEERAFFDRLRPADEQ